MLPVGIVYACISKTIKTKVVAKATISHSNVLTNPSTAECSRSASLVFFPPKASPFSNKTFAKLQHKPRKAALWLHQTDTSRPLSDFSHWRDAGHALTKRPQSVNMAPAQPLPPCICLTSLWVADMVRKKVLIVIFLHGAAKSMAKLESSGKFLPALWTQKA